MRKAARMTASTTFHHGSLIDVLLDSVTLELLLDDAKLVLIFHSGLVHEAGYNSLLSQMYLEVDDNDVYATNDAADDADGEAEIAGILLLVGQEQDSCSAKK